MRKPGFLAKLDGEGRLELVEPSDDICESYKRKSDDCLKSARLLHRNGLHENSVSMSYYAMYNCLTALLYKAGIKCENHSGSMLMLKEIFREHDLCRSIKSAKRERIDKQYYVTSGRGSPVKKSAGILIQDAEKFTLGIKVIISRLNTKA
jgi:uncharacterized protein (UPF0332 family)